MEVSISCFDQKNSLCYSIFTRADQNNSDFWGSGMIVTTVIQMRDTHGFQTQWDVLISVKSFLGGMIYGDVGVVSFDQVLQLKYGI